MNFFQLAQTPKDAQQSNVKSFQIESKQRPKNVFNIINTNKKINDGNVSLPKIETKYEGDSGTMIEDENDIEWLIQKSEKDFDEYLQWIKEEEQKLSNFEIFLKNSIIEIESFFEEIEKTIDF